MEKGAAGLGVAALVLATIAIFVPIAGIVIAWVALLLAGAAASGGARGYALGTVAVCAVNFFLLSPSLWASALSDRTSFFLRYSEFALAFPFLGMLRDEIVQWRRRRIRVAPPDDGG